MWIVNDRLVNIAWILKGTFLGAWLFGFGTLALLYFAVVRKMQPNSAVSTSVIAYFTSQNPLWWTALVVCLVVGFAIARWWAVPVALWIALAVTSLIPAGCLALLIVLIVKLRQATPGHQGV